MFEFQSLITLTQTYDKDFDIDTSYKVDVLQGSSTYMDIDTWIKRRITMNIVRFCTHASQLEARFENSSKK